MKNVGKIVTVHRVGGDVWALDKEAEVGKLGLGEKSRRHREETDRSRTVWSGQAGQDKNVWSSPVHNPICSLE